MSGGINKPHKFRDDAPEVDRFGKPILHTITHAVPKPIVDALDLLVSLNFYSSRSELVRVALRRYLPKYISMNKSIELNNFSKLKKLQLTLEGVLKWA